MKRVLVSGCFDLLHAGHVAFLREAASHGLLHVRVGSDANIENLKGKRPLFSEDERVYVLQNLECVHEAHVASGLGMLDFAPDIDLLKPDIFVVNEDGHTEGKQALCAEKSVEYKVLKRLPAKDFPARSSTDSKARTALPYRICLAGGWLDQPWISRLAAGPVVVFQIEPTSSFMDRAGLATSSRRTAQRLWGKVLPGNDPVDTARMLFACENPPGTQYVSGSQDAIGLVLPGINRLDYAGGFWPEEIESCHDPEIIAWLQSVIHMIPVGEREDGYDPLLEKNLTPEGVAGLAAAGRLAWDSILRKDASGLGKALDGTLAAWKKILPLTVSDGLMATRARLAAGSHGSCYSGCGGGYLLVVSEEPQADEVLFRITQPALGI